MTPKLQTSEAGLIEQPSSVMKRSPAFPKQRLGDHSREMSLFAVKFE